MIDLNEEATKLRKEEKELKNALDKVSRKELRKQQKEWSKLFGCPKCGVSGYTIRLGFYYKKGMKFQRYLCKKCGSVTFEKVGVKVE
jgi:transposase-like protein